MRNLNYFHKHITLTFTILILAFASISIKAQNSSEKSLYQRLGGYDAVAAVVDDFMGRMASDKQLSRFFTTLGENRKVKARQLTVDFVCKAVGGPCAYTGRDMLTTHKGMGITEDDWNISVKLLKQTLSKFKVPEKESAEVLSLIASLKSNIVDK